jgi:hypothetical protein
MILGMIVFRAVDVRLSMRAVEAAKKEVEPIDTPRAEAHGH